ncbi:MAG: hypothetical protein J5590_09155 [Clostridia bacterium]|nr:hypothetical protein [Clostridia bacterium]
MNEDARMHEGGDNAQIIELIKRYREQIESLKRKLSQYEQDDTERREALSLRDDPYYGDIEDKLSEVLDYARRHGVSAKEAYRALFAEEKARDLMAKEQKNKAKISALSQGGNSAEPEEGGVLSPDEIWAAKKAGMTIADYLKYKKRGNE